MKMSGSFVTLCAWISWCSRVLALSACLAFANGSLQADYYAGVSAYDSGDVARAVAEWRESANRGDARSQTALGNVYAMGLAVGVDHRAASEWYRKAADQGNAAAQYSLATNFAAGLGVKRDLAKAIELFRAAAERQEVRAQFELARRYEKGDGVAADAVRATKWYLAAATQGHVLAQIAVAKRFERGSVGRISLTEAYTWYYIASRRDTTFARQVAEPLRQIEERLAQVDLADARERAETWLRENL
ncbi:tetratricopeptide repeat protein [Denitrobaculum tricleocarpae]|nr:tetratricopeptide repeat protein [Denitrobaculum tricleocarpae]